MVRDVGLAEELAQDALVAALEQWPATGVPDNPGAWLMATAKHRAIDRLRRNKMLERKHERDSAASCETDAGADCADLDAALDDDVGDDLLRLIFTACHPVLSTEARVALTLRLLGGLTTDEIARAFLVPEPTIAQRIVRAKRTLAEARVPFEVPRGEELAERLASVLEVDLPDLQRGLCRHRRRRLDAAGALRGGAAARAHPGRAGAGRAGGAWPGGADGDPGLALAARASAPTGEPVLLLDQNRARWDQLLIRRGLAALDARRALGGGDRAVRAAGGDRRLPCARAHGRRDRLGAHRRALRGARQRRRRRRSSSSTAPWRWRWRSGPRRAWRSSTRCWPSRRSRRTTCCPACAATCCPSSAGSTRRAAEFERAAAMTRNARERELLLRRAGECGR